VYCGTVYPRIFAVEHSRNHNGQAIVHGVQFKFIRGFWIFGWGGGKGAWPYGLIHNTTDQAVSRLPLNKQKQLRRPKYGIVLLGLQRAIYLKFRAIFSQCCQG
jgi:hypothetical protein